MGTRNMTFVVLGGKPRVAQYGQWDGYPSCSGISVLEFLRNNDMKDFAKKLLALSYPSQEEIRQYWIEAGMDPDNEDGFVTMDVSDNFKAAHPSLQRDMGSDILQYIADNDVTELFLDDEYFKENQGFFGIEWMYLVDLDNGVLEVYSSWDLPEFADDGMLSENMPMVWRYSLDALPDNDEFLSDLGDE